MTEYRVAALYKFVPLPDYKELQKPIKEEALRLGVCGSLLLASEGMNGTIAGIGDAVDQLIAFIQRDSRFEGFELKFSTAEKRPFNRMKVRLKKEIVTMGVTGLDPLEVVGTYVKPEEWNELIASPDTLVIDTRNDYEIALGTFENAVDPETKAFRDFPKWEEENREKLKQYDKIAMFCTGGIRCEKSTAFMKERGYDNVYHLHGGILKYLEDIKEEDSMWQGECFVFDERVGVKHGLKEGEADLCRACRRPIMPEDYKHELFELGVSCRQCHHETTPEKKESHRERQRQIELARTRGQRHVGYGE